MYDFNMQRLATLTGEDATTVFDGTLHIGENMTAPTLAGNNRMKGKVYECKVYDKALSTSTLETMFPNLYSNEKRTKGALRCIVPSLRYNIQQVNYIFLDAMIDMGKYSSAEYAGKYPKAVGIRIDGVNDVLWCPTGSNTHIHEVFYINKNIGPYGSINVEIVNTGLAPGLEATIKAFHCVLMTQEKEYTDASDALDFAVEWDKDELEIKVGETLTGHVTYLPEDANSGTSITLTVSDDTATAAFEDDIITVTGVEAGEATIEAALPSGTKKAFTVTVTEADGTISVKNVALSKTNIALTEGDTATLTATVSPSNATDKTVNWSVTPEGYVTLSADTGESVTITAATAGKATITATAGAKSAACAVVVTAKATEPTDPDKTEDVPGETPVYKLAEAKTFAAENQEYIDTGIKMFESIDPKPEYTILCEVKFGENATGGNCVLMHCMDETDPYPGFEIHVVKGGLMQANCYGASKGFYNISGLKENAYKCAITISEETLDGWLSKWNHGGVDITGYDVTLDKSLLLGCYQASDGTKGRYFDGTLYQCLIYDKKLTDDQISAWLAAE